MAHCDPQMSDNANILPPRNTVIKKWNLFNGRGASAGLGCSSNGKIAICTIGYPPYPNQVTVVAVNESGIVWESFDFTNKVISSAPLIDSNGGSIIVDDEKIARLYSNGTFIWSTNTPGGDPFGPTLTKSGAIFIATYGGPISVYNPESGRKKDDLYLQGVVFGAQGYYETINTPASYQDRVYVLTNFKPNNPARTDTKKSGRLYAINIIPSFNAVLGEYDYDLQVAWYYEFAGPSGASPLVIKSEENFGIFKPVIYFDGSSELIVGASESFIFAVKDEGNRPNLIWNKSFADSHGFQASFAKDPRGGFWAFEVQKPDLIHFSEDNGQIMQRINVDELIDEEGTHRPASAMTVTGTEENPIMILSAMSTYPYSVFIIAVNLVDGGLLWKYDLKQVSDGNIQDISAGQFPIIRNEDGISTVVFSTWSNGVFALGDVCPDITNLIDDYYNNKINISKISSYLNNYFLNPECNSN